MSCHGGIGGETKGALRLVTISSHDWLHSGLGYSYLLRTCLHTYLHAYASCVQGCPSVMCPWDLSFTPYRRRARTNSNGQTQGPAEEMHGAYVRCRLGGCSTALVVFGNRMDGNGYDWSLHGDKGLSTCILRTYVSCVTECSICMRLWCGNIHLDIYQAYYDNILKSYCLFSCYRLIFRGIQFP